MANHALPVMNLIHIAPLPLQGLYTALLTKSEDVIWPLFEPMAAITCSPSKGCRHRPSPSSTISLPFLSTASLPFFHGRFLP